MNWPYRFALICGFVPLTTGTTVFIAWLLTRDDALMAVGAATTVWGSALFLVGVVSLVVYIWKARMARLENWRPKALFASLILISNVPAAAAYVMIVIYLESAYAVIVENSSPKRVDRVVLIGPNQARHEFASFAIGEHREDDFHFLGEGSVTYEVWFGSLVQTGILDGYVSTGMGGCAVLKISSDGTAESNNECF